MDYCSGPGLCASCDTTGFTEERQCYWNGSKLSKIKANNSQICAQKCRDHQACHSFVYKRNRDCVLKKRGERECDIVGRRCDAVPECSQPSKL